MQDRVYNLIARDVDADRFYHSAAWKRARRVKLAGTPWCERCLKVWAQHVHHVIALARCTEAQKTAQSNLRALCQPCHNIEEAEAAR